MARCGRKLVMVVKDPVIKSVNIGKQ